MLKALEILKNIKYDYSICNHNMVLDNDFTNILVDEAIDELEALNNRSCKDCRHHSEGKQPDGFGWENCEYNWQCSNIYENNWEPK